ncbi:MAG: hypothetical protein ACT4P7_08250 [Gemmatimonadaceae bacterium]
MRLRPAAVLVCLVTAAPATLPAQDLGFLGSVFARVHRLTLFLQSADPRQAGILDRGGDGCITLPLCGAGTEVLIDLDTRSRRIDLELGFAAGYLRPIRSSNPAEMDIRASIRSLPVVSTHVTYMNSGWIHPYFTGSFGLVDLWNGRVHTSSGKQSEVKASTFEYGVSLGAGVAPPFTNARVLLEFGHRARNFSSLGYSLTDPLPAAFPRELNLSTWQFTIGWQFDLRPLTRAPEYAGLWVLSKVDGVGLPFAMRQERRAQEGLREEIVSAYLDLDQRSSNYSLQIVTRLTTIGANGAAVEQRFADPTRETGSWDGAESRSVRLTTNGIVQATTRVDEELMVEHAATGRRLFFRKVRRS